MKTTLHVTGPQVAGPCRHKPLAERCGACILDYSEYFAALGLDAKLELQQGLKLGSFSRRERLYSEGAASRYLYILVSGKIKVYKSVAGGRQQIHKLILLPGDLVACEDLFLDRHDSTAEAFDDTTVCYIKKSALLDAMGRHPQVSDTLMRVMTRNLNSYIRHVASLGQRTAIERIASYLHFLHDTHPGYRLEQDVLTESLTRGEVADMLGITPRTLIRGLKKLEKDRVISLARDGFIILDLRALAHLSEGG